MADTAEEVPAGIDDEEPEETPGYKAPAQKTLDEIQKLDADDESLVKYKKMLLGGTVSGGDDGGPNVKVLKLSVVVAGRDDIELDLTGDLATVKDKPVTFKEGVEFRLKITFEHHACVIGQYTLFRCPDYNWTETHTEVKREIVAGLRFHQVLYRKGIRVDKTSLMVGSYGPKAEPQEFLTPPDEAPKGMLSRGHYTAKSKFLDDDKNVHLEWEWSFDIKKDWD